VSLYLLHGEETERILFQSVSPKQFDAWLPFFNDPTSFAHWITERKTAEVECKEWFEKQLDRYAEGCGGMNALIEKSSGLLIGYAGLLKQRVDGEDEREVAYSLMPDFRSKGFATEAASKCKQHAFRNNLAQSLISIISLSNSASARVATKNGMHISKRTMYHGNAVNIFRIGKEEWERRLSSTFLTAIL
jgi:[ribosomal protein S5]-alanine N-acetyltransferase